MASKGGQGISLAQFVEGCFNGSEPGWIPINDSGESPWGELAKRSGDGGRLAQLSQIRLSTKLLQTILEKFEAQNR